MTEQNLSESIKQALELIRAGKMDAARPILLEILRQDESIEQAWFLLSYTLPTGEKQEFALNQALSINPEFDRARDRLDEVRQETAQMHPEIEEKSSLATDVFQDEDSIDEMIPDPPKLEDFPEDRNFDRSVDEDPGKENAPFPQETFLGGENFEEEGKKRGVSRKSLAIAGLIILFLIILVLASFPGIMTNIFGLDQSVVEPTLIRGFRTLPPTWTP
jgi:hypothetical protein